MVWIAPAAAIETLELVFPTMKNLEAIDGYRSADELIASRRGAEIKAVQPKMLIVSGKRTFVLP